MLIVTCAKIRSKIDLKMLVFEVDFRPYFSTSNDKHRFWMLWTQKLSAKNECATPQKYDIYRYLC